MTEGLSLWLFIDEGSSHTYNLTSLRPKYITGRSRIIISMIILMSFMDSFPWRKRIANIVLQNSKTTHVWKTWAAVSWQRTMQPCFRHVSYLFDKTVENTLTWCVNCIRVATRKKHRYWYSFIFNTLPSTESTDMLNISECFFFPVSQISCSFVFYTSWQFRKKAD